LCLILATLAAYNSVRDYPFIDLDDAVYVFQNPLVLGSLNWSVIKTAFTHAYNLNYDPLTFLAHSIDVRLFQLNAGEHHEVNVVLHVIISLLIFSLLKKATGHAGRSLMVAALFALHPINVENVAWVSELKTMLSTLFFFLALGAYHWYARRPSVWRMALVSSAYILGLLAKPQVIILPFVLLLWDYWPLCRMSFNKYSTVGNTGYDGSISQRSVFVLVKEKIPLFVIALLDGIVTIFAEHKASIQEWPYSFSIRLGNAVLSYSRYLGKAFWPVNLALMYPHPGYSLRWTYVWASLCLLIAVTVFVIYEKRRRYLIVGWLWFLGTLVPMIGIIQIDWPALADRYAYISLIGIFLMICWGLTEVAEETRLPKYILPILSIAILLALAVRTHSQVQNWQDSIAVWTHSLQVTHRNRVAEMELGNEMQARGDQKDALQYFYRISAENPGDVEADLHVAYVEQQSGNLSQAILFYEKILAESKDNQVTAQSWANMGHAYSALGDNTRATQCYREAIRIRALPMPAPPPPPLYWLRKRLP
jgi:tetratricopeptide (TPR) repeat protein